MIDLSTASKQLKNSLIQDGEWYTLLTFTNRDGSITIRVVNNPDDLTFGSDIFTAFPIKPDTITESNKGELPSLNLVLSNIDRVIEGYIEQDIDLGSGWAVHVDLVHNTALASGISEMTYDFITIGATAGTKIATFTCGIRNPLRQLFPRLRFLPNACQNTFKQGGCNYIGTDTTCEKTLTACRAKFTGASKIPFLGFPGLPTNQGIYL